MIYSWLSGAKRPSKHKGFRHGPTASQGLEFASVPEFLRKQPLQPDAYLGSDGMHRDGLARKRAPVAPTDFNRLRSGGRFKLASSPIDESLLASTKSPFTTPARSVAKSVERKQSDCGDFKVAAEVLRTVNQYAISKGKEIKFLNEMEVVDILLSNIDNVLRVPFAYRCFLAFAVNEFTDELVRFYKDATDASGFFKGDLPFHVAKRLYDQYIIAGAPHEINVSGKMKEELKAHVEEAAIDQSSLSIDVFDACLFEVRSLMEDQTFSRFKRKVNKSRTYAQAVWSGQIEGIDDFELQNRDSLLLYNLFADIKTGLDKLKVLTRMTRKQNEYVREARANRSHGMYNTAALVPTRVGDLRYDEY